MKPLNLVHIALAHLDRTMLTSPDGKRIEVSLEAVAKLLDGEGMPAVRPPNVHTHGPADGPGLACPERWVGACRVIPEESTTAAGTGVSPGALPNPILQASAVLTPGATSGGGTGGTSSQERFEQMGCLWDRYMKET